MRFLAFCALAASLLIPGFVPAQSLAYQCQMSGESLSACCCAPSSADSDACATAPCACCDIVVKAAPKDFIAPISHAASHVHFFSAPVGSGPGLHACVGQDALHRPVGHAPLWRGCKPPIYILNTALLR